MVDTNAARPPTRNIIAPIATKKAVIPNANFDCSLDCSSLLSA